VRSRLALLAAAGTGIQVGAAMVATRFVADQTGPLTLALFRYAIGFACLLPAVLMAPRVRIAAGDLVPIAVLGIGQFGILIALLNFGLQSVTAARGALLFATFPLITMLFAAALGQERLTARRSLGVLLALVGVGVSLGEKLLADSGGREWLGALAILLSAATGAICSVLYRPYLAKYPALPVSALAMLASVLFLLGGAGIEGSFAAPLAIDGAGWAAIVFIGLSSGVFYFLWLWALANASPTRVTIFLSLSPVTAALLGAFMLGEPLTLWTIAGLALVIAGLKTALSAKAP